MYLEGFDYRSQLHDRTEDFWHKLIFHGADKHLADERRVWALTALSSLSLANIEDEVLKRVETESLTAAQVVGEMIDVLALASARSGRHKVAARLLGLSQGMASLFGDIEEHTAA